jgi:hypothetical protein
MDLVSQPQISLKENSEGFEMFSFVRRVLADC